jgi:CheY-like chemotaxis protein
MALETIGMFVLTASDGEQALELSRKFPGAIHALVSDIIMTNPDGLGLCKQILQERPAIKVLLMSGSRGRVNGVPVPPKAVHSRRASAAGPKTAVDGLTLAPRF